MNSNCKQNKGFSLIEMALVVAIAGLMLVGAVNVVQVLTKAKNIETTKIHIDAIQKALSVFVGHYGRLPCPASLVETSTVATAPAVYGREYCGSLAPPVAGISRTPAGGGKFVRIGTVPVYDLNLPGDYMLDGSHFRFFYAVSEDLMAQATYNTTSGAISVVDEATANVLNPANSALYVLFSAGQDGKGAYTIDGKQLSACNSAPGLDQENCNLDSTFRTAPYAPAIGGTHFDDTIVYNGDLMTAASTTAPVVHSQIFLTDGTWTPPATASAASPVTIRYLLVGGGGIGQNTSGGGSGHVTAGAANITSPTPIPVTVGKGAYIYTSPLSFINAAGSSLGAWTAVGGANGGLDVNFGCPLVSGPGLCTRSDGGNGGSGGGAGATGGGGTGGFNGGNGGNNLAGGTGGTGQGTIITSPNTVLGTTFKGASFIAGKGGSSFAIGVPPGISAGGGGGGIYISGALGNVDETQINKIGSGKGFGAGGGNTPSLSVGNGNDGVVYVEWD